MRKLAVLLALGQLVLAQGQAFNRRYDLFSQHHGQVAWSIDPNGSDGYSVTSTTNYDDSVYLYITAALIRLDADGEVLGESKMLDGMSSVYAGWANCSDRVSDGGIAIGGSTYPPSEIANAAIIRYAANGDSLWLREYGDLVNDWIGRQVKQTKDGGYILAGEHVVGNQNDAFLIKTDDLGNEQWTQSYGGPFSDYAMSVDTTADDGYFVGGQYKVTQNNKNFWVFRVDGDGGTVWNRQWGGAWDEPNAHMCTLANGDPIIASAWGYLPDFAHTRFYMAELDQVDGHLIWEREYGAIHSSTLFSVKEVRPGEGAIAAGGYIEPDTINFYKGVLLRTAPNGDSLWMRTYVFAADSLFHDGLGEFKDVIPTNDGGFIACGWTTGSYSGINPPGLSQDAWVVKVDSLGCLVPGCDATGISEIVTNLRDALTLFPNPAHGQVSIQLHLPTSYASKDLRLSLVSSDGRVVRQVPWRSRAAMVLDVQDLSPGLYTMHVTDGGTWVTGGKLIIE